MLSPEGVFFDDFANKNLLLDSFSLFFDLFFFFFLSADLGETLGLLVGLRVFKPFLEVGETVYIGCFVNTGWDVLYTNKVGSNVGSSVGKWVFLTCEKIEGGNR